MTILIPVILCGGSGTRLWPMSRESFPKQFLNLVGDHSLLQNTVRRALAITKAPPENLVIVTLDSFKDDVRKQLDDILPGTSVHMLGEPSARNTAAAVAYAAAYIADTFGNDAIMWVLPADHHIGDQDQLEHAFAEAAVAASRDYLVTFGIRPTRPDTGYGYIQTGKADEAGLQFSLNLLDRDEKIEIFTAQPEMLSGASFVGIAPDHPFAKQLGGAEAGFYTGYRIIHPLNKFLSYKEENITTVEAFDAKRAWIEGEVAAGHLEPYIMKHMVQNRPVNHWEHKVSGHIWRLTFDEVRNGSYFGRWENINPRTLPVFVVSPTFIDNDSGAMFGCPAHSTRDADFAARYDVPVIPESPQDQAVLPRVIEAAEKKQLPSGVMSVKAFYEKPDLETAKRYLAAGDFLWNSGMFVFRAGAVLDQFHVHAPAVIIAARKALSAGDKMAPSAQVYDAIPKEPFDKAIMEKSDRIKVVPCDPKWSDIGSWESLWEIDEKDTHNNVIKGEVTSHDLDGCYIQSYGNRVVACAGLKNLVIVDTGDAVLIADRTNSEAVKALVGKLKDAGRTDILKELANLG